MTRGQLICIAENDTEKCAYYRSCEFNGDMYIEGGHGEEIIERFSSGDIKTLEDFRNYVNDFDDKNFQYAKEDGQEIFGIVDIYDEKENWSFWYRDDTCLYDITSYPCHSDYLYVMNLTQENVEFAASNGIVLIPAGGAAVFCYDFFEDTELNSRLLTPEEESKVFPEQHIVTQLLEKFSEDGLTREEAEEMRDSDQGWRSFNIIFDSVWAFGEYTATSIGIEEWMRDYFDFRAFGEKYIADTADDVIILSTGRVASA